MRKTLHLFFLFIAFLSIQSCTLTHRVYRKGIYVEHPEKVKRESDRNRDDTLRNYSPINDEHDSLRSVYDDSIVNAISRDTLPENDSATRKINPRPHGQDSLLHNVFHPKAFWKKLWKSGKQTTHAQYNYKREKENAKQQKCKIIFLAKLVYWLGNSLLILFAIWLFQDFILTAIALLCLLALLLESLTSIGFFTAALVFLTSTVAFLTEIFFLYLIPVMIALALLILLIGVIAKRREQKFPCQTENDHLIANGMEDAKNILWFWLLTAIGTIISFIVVMLFLYTIAGIVWVFQKMLGKGQ